MRVPASMVSVRCDHCGTVRTHEGAESVCLWGDGYPGAFCDEPCARSYREEHSPSKPIPPAPAKTRAKRRKVAPFDPGTIPPIPTARTPNDCPPADFGACTCGARATVRCGDVARCDACLPPAPKYRKPGIPGLGTHLALVKRMAARRKALGLPAWDPTPPQSNPGDAGATQEAA